MSEQTKRKVCFNPFNKPASHSRQVTDLRPISAADLCKVNGADENSLLCSACRKELNVYNPTDSQALSSSQIESVQSSSEPLSSQEVFPKVEKSIDILVGVSPVKRKLFDRPSYTASKLDEIQEVVRKKFKSDFNVNPVTSADEIIHDYSVIIENLKRLIQQETDKKQKMIYISLCPNRWSVSKIVDIFNVPRRLVENARKLQNEDITEQKKPGRQCLDELIESRVIEFYENDQNSRYLPGKKDFKSIIQKDGERVRLKKKIVLCNLSELYQSYKEQFPSDKISFSKFAMLRPKNCVLAGSSGTHVVCVCLIHENARLMLEGCQFKKLFSEQDWYDITKSNYRNLINKIVCENPTLLCFDRTCTNCKNTCELKEIFIEAFEKHQIEEINYKIWVTTDRCTMLSDTKDVDEFSEILFNLMEKLITHDFIAAEQNKFYANLKNNLKPGEFAILLDFAENFAFVMQNAVQAFHWNNKQSTLFPVIIYYKENNELKHRCFIYISDCLKHDTISVYMFQKNFIEFLKSEYAEIDKIYYMSDGAPQQFKNKKNFVNICYHKEDFGFKCEWHFFATSHGKGPCDGIAGSTKRLAHRASLQQGSTNPILNAHDLFEWAKTAIKNVTFFMLEMKFTMKHLNF